MSRSALATPMMRQYLAIKAEHPDALLLYRMGDFYELFLRDAEVAAEALDITLTTRDRGKADAVPMCGVPVHSADAYLKRLVDLGHRVAVCEQVEDARAAAGRRLVKREVVEVLTPGLVGDPEGLPASREVCLVALVPSAGEIGLATLEATTGDFRATAVPAGERSAPSGAILDELRRIGPREILVPSEALDALRPTLADVAPEAAVSPIDAASLDPSQAPGRPDGFDPDRGDAATRAAAALLHYLGAHQPFALRQVVRLRPYRLTDAMILDASTRAHLELFENSEDRRRTGTLIERIDASVTALGARRLARWLSYPLLDPAAIASRQEAVTWLVEHDRPRARVREALKPVRDLERLLSRAARPGATPRDLAALRGSLEALPGVVASLAVADETALLADGASRPAALPVPVPVPAAAGLLRDALVDEPPTLHRGSRGAGLTGYIRRGFRTELDGLRESASKGREWIAGLELRERERTGIPSLKVRFHPVHGYSLEVTRSNLSRVPEEYERKQTLVSAERFTTPELREMETSVLGANDRAAALERELFEGVREEVLGLGPAIRDAAEAVAELDALASLAEVARRDAWTRPVVDDGEGLEIRAGRHPVVEAHLVGRGGDEFVPNDTDLDAAATQILVLTGPNMSGKSTYLRQVALIVLLAQMGSYVPAEAARIGAVDRVFTRVGASDRLARGESTFMVEMRETAEILTHASPRSLIILDEIGRGTSTFDGLSIAWSVLEYLHDTPALSARTLFATHYHELTDLARTRPRVANAHFEARQWGDEVLFLRRLVPGGASRSYGIQVARLAGLPDTVIARSKEVLDNLEAGELLENGRPRLARHAADEPAERDQLSLFGGAGSSPGEQAALSTLRGIDPDRMTPIEALVTLQRLVETLKQGKS